MLTAAAIPGAGTAVGAADAFGSALLCLIDVPSGNTDDPDDHRKYDIIHYFHLTPLSKDLRSLRDNDRLCKLIIDIIPTVLNRNCTASLTAGDHRDRFAAVAAKGEQKAIQFLIVRIDMLDDVFRSFLYVQQSHSLHPILQLSVSCG